MKKDLPHSFLVLRLFERLVPIVADSVVQAGADLGAKDKKGRTALTYAKEGKFKRVVAYLESAYEKRDAAGALTLGEAAATGTLYRVKALLEAGADVEQSDEHGQRPLMFAVAAGQVEVVSMLCAAGANVHAIRDDGGDLWTCALAKPNAEVIRCLIEHGLSPNQTRKSGPALLLAFGSQKPTDILKLLLDNGADVHAPVPVEVIEKATRKRQKSAELLKAFGPRVSRETRAAEDLKNPCSVLAFAKHFASRDVYYLLHTYGGGPEERDEFFYEVVRDALKQCAVRADEKFKAEAARIGAICAYQRPNSVVVFELTCDLESQQSPLLQHAQVSRASDAAFRAQGISCAPARVLCRVEIRLGESTRMRRRV